MSTKELYTQVKLQKQSDEKTITHQTCWIDARLAKVGKTLELKQDDRTWEGGWTVIEKYTTRWMDPTDRPWLNVDSAVTKQLNWGHK